MPVNLCSCFCQRRQGHTRIQQDMLGVRFAGSCMHNPLSESAPETASVTMNIPNGAKEFNGHYYYVYEGNDYSDWNAAQEYCIHKADT